MYSKEKEAGPVVLLVDDKTRDLDVAILIGRLFEERGIECRLEPLEAFRAVLGAYRPSAIIFNHLYASHLAAWSRRLAEMGVLVAVLLNEGIVYDQGEMQYIAGRHYRDAHADFYFCWNEPHKQAILEHNAFEKAHIEVIGAPRFDFYVEPWSRLVYQPDLRPRKRPQILLCTNFVTARYRELPREAGDKFFAAWFGKIPLFDEYRSAIEAHWKGRNRFFDYLNAVVDDGRYDVVLRPHPREDVAIYKEWFRSLDETRRQRVRMDATSNVSALILSCDLEISCETCTTAIESWIAGKPTIELMFERHPLWHREEHAAANVPCAEPAELPDLIAKELAEPAQARMKEVRRRHLAKWCFAADGRASERLVETLAAAIRSKRDADWSKLDFNDHRRAAKLKIAQRLGLAYHFDALLPLKRALFGDRYAIREYAYQKAIKPADVAARRTRFDRVLRAASPATPATADEIRKRA